MPSLVRRRIAALCAAAGLALLSGCGFNVPTDAVYQPAEGVNVRTGQVDVLGAMVVSGENGSGQFIATLVNNSTEEADALTGITGSSVKVATVSRTPIPVNSAGFVNLADSEFGSGVTVTGESVKSGRYVTVELTFAEADPVKVSVPVVAATGPYADITPSAEPSANPDGTQTSGPAGETPSENSSPAASATPTNE